MGNGGIFVGNGGDGGKGGHRWLRFPFPQMSLKGKLPNIPPYRVALSALLISQESKGLFENDPLFEGLQKNYFFGKSVLQNTIHPTGFAAAGLVLFVLPIGGGNSGPVSSMSISWSFYTEV